MGTLLYFILIAGFFFLMMRVGCGSHVTGHGHGEREGREGHDAGAARDGGLLRPPASEIDPVCRMTVHTDTAKSTVYKGRIFYFCSAEHRDQFEAAPDRYAGRAPGPEPKPAEHSHV